MCTATRRIPEGERAWRQKANSIRAGANAASRAANPNVNLVTDDNVHIKGGVRCRCHRKISRRTEPGKWGRAIRKLDAKQMAQLQGGRMGAYVLVCNQVGHEDSTSEPADSLIQLSIHNVHDTDVEYMVIDLYAVRPESHEIQKKGIKPFIHQVKLHGPGNERIQVWGLFDNGAMVDAMSTTMYSQVKHALAPLGRLTRHLQMANGSIVNPVGCWKGTVELGGATVTGSFEVFDSGGGWDFLFGKRLMTAFSAVHDYATDEVFLPTHQLTLQNQHDITMRPPQVNHKVDQTQKEEVRETQEGDNAQSPMRGVLIDPNHTKPQSVDTPEPARMSQQETAKAQEQLPMAETSQSEERAIIKGDRATSPWREVPHTAFTKDEPPTDDSPSHRAFIEEVEDVDSQGYKARKEVEEEAEVAKEPIQRQQQADSKEWQYQGKTANKDAKKTQKAWKGPSQ